MSEVRSMDLQGIAEGHFVHREPCAIVAAARVTDRIRLMGREEKDLARLADQLAAALVTDKAAGAREHDLVAEWSLFEAGLRVLFAAGGMTKLQERGCKKRLKALITGIRRGSRQSGIDAGGIDD